jgi:hypothetical protein
VTATNLQTAAMTVSAVLIPVAFAGGNWISRSNFWGILFVVVLYGSVLAAVVSTFVRYRKEQRSCLAKWLRIPYEIGLFLLLVLSLCPIATWTLALRGAAPQWRLVFQCLFGANAAATVLVWFGRGWSRVGLTMVAFWIRFLWVFPLGVGVKADGGWPALPRYCRHYTNGGCPGLRGVRRPEVSAA